MDVLIVDDSKIVRLYHKEILKDLGYSVGEAENGMEALEKCAQERFKLFLVDINMPVMDGYTFVESLRKFEHFANIPVIMISTEAEDMDRHKAYEAGADLYFVKPIKPDAVAVCTKVLIG